MKKLLDKINSMFSFIGPSESEIREQIRQNFSGMGMEVIDNTNTEHQSPNESGPPVQQSEAVHKYDADNNGAVINFKITSAGNLTIDMRWTDHSDLTAHSLAALLHNLDNDKLSYKYQEILRTAMNEDATQRLFIEKVFKYWQEFVDDEAVIVEPSDVFSLGKQIQAQELQHVENKENGQ